MTVHSPVCVIKLSHVVTVFHRLLLIRTVTCRQFPNLTFAPRNTCYVKQQPHASSLSCHSSLSIQDIFLVLQLFFTFFSIFLLYFLMYNFFLLSYWQFSTPALYYHRSYISDADQRRWSSGGYLSFFQPIFYNFIPLTVDFLQGFEKICFPQ